MGYIYKIVNNLNNKCYIGQTNRSYNDRWAEHKRDRFKEPYCQWPLYRMINKIGLQNISFVLLEETDNLDDREKYWIQFYNSQKDGYNIQIGGSNGVKYNYQEILDYWHNDGEHNFTKTANHFNAHKSTITRIIKELGYERRTWEQINSVNHDSIKRAINQIDLSNGKVLNTFNSISDAAKAIGDPNAKNSISGVCLGKRPSLCGYGWQYVEDIGKPILLHKQVKRIVLPEYNLIFENKIDCAKWFIDNNICRSKNIMSVEGSICRALIHSGKYFNVTIQEEEKVIITHYE